MVVAGDHFWAGLRGILLGRQRKGGLARIDILFVENYPASLRCANGMFHVLKTVFPEITVSKIAIGASFSDAAGQQLQTWFENSTGFDLMINIAASPERIVDLLPFVSTHEVTLLSLDATRGLIEIRKGPGQSGLEILPISAASAEPMDSIPVNTLLEACLFASDANRRLHSLSISPLPAPRLTEMGIAKDWNWTKAFDECGIGSKEKPFVLFIRYLAACLLELGLNNFAAGIRIPPVPDQKIKADLDLVVNKRGRLTVIDVHLLDESDNSGGILETLPMLIRQAVETRRFMSQAGIRWILFLPCRALTPAEIELTSSYDLEVIDKKDAPRFLTRLARMFGIVSLPETLQQTEGFLQKQAAEKPELPLFTRIQSEKHTVTEASILDIDNYLDRQAAERKQNWITLVFRNRVHFRLFQTNSALRNRLEPLARKLSGFNSLYQAGNSLEFIFNRNEAIQTQLRNLTTPFIGKYIDWEALIKALEAIPAQEPVDKTKVHKTAPRQHPDSTRQNTRARQPRRQPRNTVYQPGPTSLSTTMALTDLDSALDAKLNLSKASKPVGEGGMDKPTIS